MTTNQLQPSNSNKPSTNFDDLYQIVKSLSVLDQDGEVNLTPIAKAFNKRIDNWKRNYADILQEIAFTQNEGTENNTDSQKVANAILRQKQGGNGEQGTFTNNPDVFLEFLRYCNVKLAVKMTKIVSELFRTGTVSLQLAKPLTIQELLAQSQNWLTQLSQENTQLKIDNVQKDEIIVAVSNQLEITANKAKFVDQTFINNQNHLTAMNMYAKNIGANITELYALLRQKKVWFYSLNQHLKNENNVNATYIKNGCFKIEKVLGRDGQIYNKIFITAKGSVLVYKLWNDYKADVLIGTVDQIKSTKLKPAIKEVLDRTPALRNTTSYEDLAIRLGLQPETMAYIKKMK